MRDKISTTVRLSSKSREILEDIARRDSLHLAAHAQTPQSLIDRGWVPGGEEDSSTIAGEVFAALRAWAYLGMDVSFLLRPTQPEAK
jgi:hypothetical protein